MKKALAILLASATLFLAMNNASAQDKWVLNHVGIGVSGGLDGIGADLVLPVSPFIQVRAGYAMQPMTFDVATEHISMSKAQGAPWDIDDDVTATVSSNLDAAHLFLDFYLGKKSGLHLTVGAYYGMHPEAGGPWRIGTKEPLPIPATEYGTTGIELQREGQVLSDYITTDKQGYLNVDVSLDNPLGTQIGMPNLYPYAGIGFGRNLSSKRISLTMDLGGIYTGRCGINGYNYMYDENGTATQIHASDLAALTDAGLDEETVAKIQNIYGKVESLPVTPMLKFNLFIRLF